MVNPEFFNNIARKWYPLQNSLTDWPASGLPDFCTPSWQYGRAPVETGLPVLFHHPQQPRAGLAQSQ